MDRIALIAAAGLAAQARAFEASASRVAANPHVDLAAELVRQKLARTAFEANVVTLRTALGMTGSLLDLLV